MSRAGNFVSDALWSAYYRQHGTRPVTRATARVLSNRERLAVWRLKETMACREERDGSPGPLVLTSLPPEE